MRAFELTFEHRWIYIFELVQNALDARARSIMIRLAEDGDALIFQHDGTESVNEKNVEGLSKVFRSTKGDASVGFMGIGFKSVFGRFREARISGWKWTFRYEVPQVVGETYGDVQTDPLGAVMPIWDDRIAAPEAGFTTRFEMRQCTGSAAELRQDIERFLPDHDRTLLAILAESGLECLDVDGRVWDLGVHAEPDGTREATALSRDESMLWQLFPVQFNPSKKAIARFLEHRRIQPTEAEREQVHAQAARSCQVLGVLLLDDYGVPVPRRGRVYATLPMDVTLPFDLHIHADWLPTISRTGLPEIEDNAWQREIVDRIADVLASFLCWVAHTFSGRAAAKAAFAVLKPPSPDASGLEALLADEHWLSRLPALLEDAAVLPVWTEETGDLAFVKPGDAIVPPTPLADAFEEQPDLRPAVLLKGPVLMREVLGDSAYKLLSQAGLLAEMSPLDLERTWTGGLERWWETLAGEASVRRDLLFRVWAAVSALDSKEGWEDIELPCIRTIAGKWLPVKKAVFFNESLPSEKEPGGSGVHQFIQPFLRDATRLPTPWINKLRQGARGWRGGPLSQAREWIEKRARCIALKDTIGEAITTLASSPTPELSVLVSLGHWAKHRNRTDLLTHVLVESENSPRCVRIGSALLADPYVERGQSRRCLFPASPAISALYLTQDPESAGPREWRTFIETAGAKGALEVRPVEDHASRGQRKHVAEFLGCDLDEIGKSNDDGYKLQDFDIMPELPHPGASEELQAALAPWLDDGCRALEGKGRRQTSYSYYSSRSCKGNRPSAWVTKLPELAWVPCDKSGLRRPKDVLLRPDPAREAAPVARLSSELLVVLEQEGVKFGEAIPAATSLRKLSTMGSRLDAKALAELLRECREQIATDEDRRHFEQILRALAVPSDDGARVRLDRIVQRVGGSLRGALGGWIVPLNRIDEALRDELKHADFPYEFPDTTTGSQALAYIRDVWKRTRSSPERLASEVSDVLPTAYAYCLEDCTGDTSLSERWDDAAQEEAAVFSDREWVVLAETDDIFFDDIEDRRFFPSHVQLRTVTGGHLGHSRPDQLRTVEALGLSLLSSSVMMEWREVGSLSVSGDWTSRFGLVCALLRWTRGSEQANGNRMGTEIGTEPRVRRCHELALNVSFKCGSNESVPVHARLHEGALTVAGQPVQFGSDAAKELLRDFSFGQRGGLAADLTGMLVAIDDASDFALAMEKFRRSFAPNFELPPLIRPDSGKVEKAADSENESTRAANIVESKTGKREVADASARQSPFPGGPERDKPDSLDDTLGADTRSDAAYASGHNEYDESGSTGSSYTRDRALASQNALADALKKGLKGEIVPSDEDDDADEAGKPDGGAGAALGDEEYRDAAARYEMESGRELELCDPGQTGWDIRSVDPETGAERLIEVKGKGRPWDEDEVVELSRAQVRKAFETSTKQTARSWYLYVVERLDDGRYNVLPIANPVDVAAKWILGGKSWRMIAEEPLGITIEPAEGDALRS